MDSERLFDLGERGIHLLFDTQMIHDALDQSAKHLRAVIDANMEEIQQAVVRVLGDQSPGVGRGVVDALPRDVRHVLVLLYLEMLDERLRRRDTRH
jgi:hypothetical protein